MLALGKKPASSLNKKAIMFDQIFDTSKIPTPPIVFGNQALVKTWYTYSNDEFGDCVWAAKAHMHMLWSLMGGNPRDRFTTFDVLSDYAAQTGFNASDPNSDQGTDMKAAAEYHRKTGVRDATNHRRQVTSYVNLQPGSVGQFAVAAYIFGAVEIGVLITEDNMNQFDRGKPWTVTKADPVGGHCIPVVGRDTDGNFICITWGRLQKITPAFIKKYMDEGIAYLNEEILNKLGLSSEAYDKATLQKMLAQVSTLRVAEAETEEVVRYGFAAMPEAGTNKFPSDEQLDVAFKILRTAIDKSGYGWALTDAKLKVYSDEVALGVVNAATPQPTTEDQP